MAAEGELNMGHKRSEGGWSAQPRTLDEPTW